MLFLGIFLSNAVFFFACLIGIISSVRAFLRSTMKRCYLFCCLCGNKRALQGEINDYQKNQEAGLKIKEIEFIQDGTPSLTLEL